MQTITVRDLLNASLRTLTVASQGRDPTPSELNDALYILNEVADSWNLTGDMIYARQYLTFPTNSSYTLTPNGVYYTLGPLGSGANWEMPAGMTRPSTIEFASFQLPVMPVVNKPLRILKAAEWAAIQSAQVQSTIPVYIYIDEQYPIANVYIWPVPSNGSTITLDLWVPMNSNWALSDTLQLPPAYSRAFKLEVACNSAPEYGMAGDPNVQAMASTLNELKQIMTIANIQNPKLQYDIPPGPGIYNVLTDELY